ncbi:MAG: U32 family peptidase, partial [Candidatus Accumulibacter sp.]|nr:U32 family peptidase [Accumulibacter sp.]
MELDDAALAVDGRCLVDEHPRAGNDVGEIARLCEFAHRYRARVFVALNTILHDSELEGGRRLAWQAWDAGADALIVQDMGLLEVDLPPIQLHARTQTDLRSRDKARLPHSPRLPQPRLAPPTAPNPAPNLPTPTP